MVQNDTKQFYQKVNNNNKVLSISRIGLNQMIQHQWC